MDIDYAGNATRGPSPVHAKLGHTAFSLSPKFSLAESLKSLPFSLAEPTLCLCPTANVHNSRLTASKHPRSFRDLHQPAAPPVFDIVPKLFPRSLLSPLLAMFAPLSFFFASFLVVSSFAAPDTLFPTRTSHNDLVDRSNPLDVILTPLPKGSPAAYLTNAQRLSHGLPLNRPRAYHHRKAVRPRQSSTCPQKTGTIAVNIADLGAGFVARSANPFGEYTFTTDRAEALSVSIPQCETASGFFEIAPLVSLAFLFVREGPRPADGVRVHEG